MKDSLTTALKRMNYWNRECVRATAAHDAEYEQTARKHLRSASTTYNTLALAQQDDERQMLFTKSA